MSFLSCDWGTTTFRLRWVDSDTARVIREVATSDGVQGMVRSLAGEASAEERARAFRRTLARRVNALIGGATGARPEAVVVSGMASSSVGWRELPYAAVPFEVDGASAQTAWLDVETAEGGKLPVLLVSGVATASEMMRGEETQVIGLSARPEWARFVENGWMVIPGTHSKHIRLEGGRVTTLRTYMTGELFAVLREHSILRFSVEPEDAEWDEPAFAAGVAAAKGQGLSRSLFQVRTRSVLAGRSAGSNRDFLSGLLLGDEWNSSRRDAEAAPVLLAASGGLAHRYLAAAGMVGLGGSVTVVPEEGLDRAVTDGHRQLLRRADHRFRVGQ